VKTGRKRQTIRGRRKGARVGMMMHLDGNVRQRGQFRLVNPPPPCKVIDTVIIGPNTIRVCPWRLCDDDYESLKQLVNKLRADDFSDACELENFVLYGADEMECFARADGFLSFAEMRDWWIKNHGADCFPFLGEVYRW
jgi:hypothetical protein